MILNSWPAGAAQHPKGAPVCQGLDFVIFELKASLKKTMILSSWASVRQKLEIVIFELKV